MNIFLQIQLLEYPIPARPAAAVSQKPSSADISETESGIIDPLVSKLPEKNKVFKILGKYGNILSQIYTLFCRIMLQQAFLHFLTVFNRTQVNLGSDLWVRMSVSE